MARLAAPPGAAARATSPAGGMAKLLAVSSAVVLLTVVTWLASLALATPTGAVSEQLASLSEGMALYRWGFINAALINPAFVAMLYSAWMLLSRRPMRPHEVMGALVIATYWLLPTLAYIAQFALLPRLLEAGAGAEVWYFANPASVTYWLAITGYGLFGIGAMLLASGFLAGKGRGFGWVLLASGVMSTAGLVGYAMGSDVLEFAATIGGALVLPLAVMGLLVARRHVPVE